MRNGRRPRAASASETVTAFESLSVVPNTAVSLRSSYGMSMEDGAVRMIMSVQPEFLDRSFAAITAAHGTVEAYAQAVLGADQASIEAMAQKLVV